jgi:hypothetical protein
VVAFGSLALVSLCLDSWSLPSTWHAVLEANGQLSTWLPRQLSRPDWLFFIMRATIMLAEPETKRMRFQIHNQYAHSRPALLTSYSKNLIRYVASYMQGDSAAHRRSLSVSRTSKFAQALARPPDVWRRLSLAWGWLLYFSIETRRVHFWGWTDLCRF